MCTIEQIQSLCTSVFIFTFHSELTLFFYFGLDTSFWFSYGLAWSTMSGSVPMLHPIMRLSMEHHERVSINAPPHNEA